MSLFHKRVANLSASEMVAEATARRQNRTAHVDRESALRHSAVWAALRLRADVISSMPIDVFRRVGGVQVEMPKPKVLTEPSVRMIEWVYSTQVDLDSTGNAVGIIRERDGFGNPSTIELADIDTVSFIGRGSKIEKVRIDGVEYDPAQVWHEKQYTRSGIPVGLSPIHYAAAALNTGLSAQEFAANWFSNSTVPGGHLKNTAKTLNKEEATRVKQNFRETVAAGDVWVSGNDWEYDMLSAKASEAQFLDAMEATVLDICRFLAVPADLVEAAAGGSSVTYANITQRNLQLLVMNLGPAIARREDAWSARLVPQPRFVKIRTDSILRMDTKTRYEAYGSGIEHRWLTPNEVRAMEDLAPLTDDQRDEFQVFSKTPTTSEGRQ